MSAACRPIRLAPRAYCDQHRSQALRRSRGWPSRRWRDLAGARARTPCSSPGRPHPPARAVLWRLRARGGCRSRRGRSGARPCLREVRGSCCRRPGQNRTPAVRADARQRSPRARPAPVRAGAAAGGAARAFRTRPIRTVRRRARARCRTQLGRNRGSGSSAGACGLSGAEEHGVGDAECVSDTPDHDEGGDDRVRL